MLSDDTVHFALSIGCESLKTEADSKGRGWSLGARNSLGAAGSGADQIIRAGSAASGAPGSWVPGCFWVCVAGEMQCGHAVQEFRASVEVKTGTVSAQVGGERFEAVTSSGRICDIEAGLEAARPPVPPRAGRTLPARLVRGGWWQSVRPAALPQAVLQGRKVQSVPAQLGPVRPGRRLLLAWADQTR